MSQRLSLASPARLAWLLASGVWLTACQPSTMTPPAPPPVEVTATTVIAKDTPVSFEYVGQTESSRMVEIRARVDGYLQRQFYEEGALVREGAPLFQMDPRQLAATAQSARAMLQQNESRLDNARQTVARLKPLVADEAISLKDMDDAVAAEKSAAAAVESSRANLSRAEMDLGYTKLVAPLNGLAGKANVSEGSYVNPGQNGLLTTVAQLDPIFVNFSLSENEWLNYAEELKKGTLRFPTGAAGFDVQLILSNTLTMPTQGKLNFSSQTVDPQTGSYAIRASFPNPDLLLRPGQFVRVRLLGASRPNALLVPQRAILQGQKGKFVYVIGKEDKAEMRPVEVGDWIGDQWLVSSGLKSGERVVLDGTLKVQPGALLKVSPSPEAAVTPTATGVPPAKPAATSKPTASQ